MQDTNQVWPIFTGESGKTVAVNPNNVAYIREVDHGQTYIYHSYGGSLTVIDSFDIVHESLMQVDD